MEVVGAGDPAHDENDASILSQYLPALWPARRLVKRHEIASGEWRLVGQSAGGMLVFEKV